MDLYELRINEIIKKFSIMFLNNPNIVGVGVGNKVVNGHMLNKPTLTFFVVKKLSSSSLNNRDIISKNIMGISTDVLESGCFRMKGLRANDKDLQFNKNVLKTLDTDKPALGGGCLMFPEKPSQKLYSTLTYAVTEKGTRNNIYFLTSAHLWDDVDKKYVKYVQYASTIANISKKKWPIGKLSKLVEHKYDPKNKGLVIEVDAAIGKVGVNNDETRGDIVPGLLNGKIITSIQPAKRGDVIYKYGISTALTEGTVSAINASIRESQEDKTKGGYNIYANQILTKQIVEDGDSGALGVIKDTQKAFGMLNAGGKEYVSYSDIDVVFNKLNIEFLI